MKKAYPKVNKRQKSRIWKLKRLEKEEVGEHNYQAMKKKSTKDARQQEERE